jgi:hypothetical protein
MRYLFTVPRKSKNSEQTPPPADRPTLAQNDGRSSPPEKKPAARRTATAVRKPAGQRRKAEVTDEAIRVRAYFISQERIRLAIPGDPKSDWIEARRQLLAELGES